MKATNEIGINIEGNDLYARMTSGYFSDTDEGEVRRIDAVFQNIHKIQKLLSRYLYLQY